VMYIIVVRYLLRIGDFGNKLATCVYIEVHLILLYRVTNSAIINLPYFLLHIH
jgi:hypothetical protein